MQAMRRLGVLVIAILTLITYGVSVADADGALCFGRDGHEAVEGAAEHQAPSPSADGGLATLTDHGPCVDVAMPARDADTPHAAAPVVVTVASIVADHAGPATASRRDGHPLVPFTGFGSTLLRI